MQQIDEVWLSICERVFGAARDLNAVKLISSLQENAFETHMLAVWSHSTEYFTVKDKHDINCRLKRINRRGCSYILQHDRNTKD